jgi:hypothetical protein
LTAVSNDNSFLGGSHGRGTLGLHLLHHLHALNDLSKHNVLSVQMGSRHGADEKLAPVGVWAAVGHAQNTRSIVLELEALVGKLFAVDGLAAGSISARKVTPLAHKVGNDAVEGAALVAVALFHGAQGTEVFGGLGDNVLGKLHDNAAGGLVANSDVKKNSRIRHYEVVNYV